MPYEKSDYFETPCGTDPLWRYMPIDKFLTMLNEQSLYFPNIIKFKDEDKYEGTLSLPSESLVFSRDLFDEKNTPIKQDHAFLEMKKMNEEVLEMKGVFEKFPELTMKEVAEQLHAAGGFFYHKHSFEALLTNFSNRLMFCNSWFLRKNESYSMWTAYGDERNPTSIAIQTTVGDLIDSFKSNSFQIHIGKVEYIDYKTDHIKGYEDFLHQDLTDPEIALELFYAPILHKNDIYKDEDEVRAIISFESICNKYFGRVYTSKIPYYSKLLDKEEQPDEEKSNGMEKIRKGFPIDVNLQTLLNKIVISPNFNDYFYNTFEDLLKYYNIDPGIIHLSVI